MRRHAHWCDRCMFLATWDGPDPHDEDLLLVKMDLYFCPGSLGGTLLARYGSAESAYISYDLETVVVAVTRWPDIRVHPAIVRALRVVQLRQRVDEMVDSGASPEEWGSFYSSLLVALDLAGVDDKAVQAACEYAESKRHGRVFAAH